MKTQIENSLKLPLALAVSVLFPLAAFAQNAVIAKLGNDTITADSVRPYLENLTERERKALQDDPRLLNQTVRTLMLQQMLLKEAVAAGWAKRPEVEERVERARQALIAEAYLDEIAKVPDGYPAETEVKDAFEARKSELVVPRQFQLAQIYISSAGGDAAAAKVRLESVQAKLKQPGANFAAIASDHSDDTSTSSRGGEIGWIADASLQPEIRKALASLGKGATSAPIPLEDGYHIIRILDIREARPATFDEVRDQLARLLREQRARLNREAYLAKLQQQNPISINELALGQLLAPDKK